MKKTCLLALVLLGLAAAANAQRMAPGLWEHTMTMKSAGGQTEAAMAQMQQQMAAMSPDQRKMVEEMMARQGVGVSGRNTTVQVCVTKEQAARDEFPQDRNCTQQSMQRDGNTVRFKFACSGNPPASGEGEFTMTGDRAYTGRSRVSTTVQGKPEQMDMQMSGKWLAADCGSIKPR